MPSFTEALAPQSVDNMMPKKRQQGFDVSHSSVPSNGVEIFPSSSSYHQPTNTHMFHHFGSNGLPSSFIDTDILLNDELWNDFSPGNHHPPPDSMQVDHNDPSDFTGYSASRPADAETGLEGSFVDIPYSQSLDMFGLESRTLATSRLANDASGRLSKDTSSMDDGDSPDGSNGETISTVATSILSPGSHGTMADNASKTHHQRASSNVSTTSRKKTARSLSRSRNRAAAGASERRAAERSPSIERGGFGKAPSSRARPSRRATIGPAALANSVPGNTQGRMPSSVPASDLSSSLQNTGHRWGLLGAPESLDHGGLHLNLHDQHGSLWGARPLNSSRSGHDSASSSLPNPLSFQTSMQHMHLQTPPLNAAYLSNADDDASKSLNPFLFPPYTQAPLASAHPEFNQGNDGKMDSTHVPYTGASSAEDTLSKTVEVADNSNLKPVPPSKVRRNSNNKAPKGARAKPTKEPGFDAGNSVVDAAERQDESPADAKVVDRVESFEALDDDEDDDDDDENHHVIGISTPEVEAKRLAEKRRRRRESHNAVERRRRDNINEKITELATLLPESMLLDAIATSTQGGNIGTGGAFAPALAAKAALAAAAAASAAGDSLPDRSHTHDDPKTSTAAYAAALAPAHANSEALAAAQAKPNKGIILRKSVEYIRHLQQFLDMQMGRIGFLESEMQRCHQVMASSGIQAPAPSDPHHGLGMMNAFMDAASDTMFNETRQQPAQDFSTMNMLSLGMPPGHALHHQQHNEQQIQQQAQNHQSRHNQQQQHHHHHQAPPMSLPSSGPHDGAPPALAAWLDGFDQRTGLPRRSSVDPIEEEEHDDEDFDKELSRRGRSQSSRLSHDGQDDDWRGRSRQKGNRKAVQEGSWPELHVSEAQSPMQDIYSSRNALSSPSFADLGNIKIEMQ